MPDVEMEDDVERQDSLDEHTIMENKLINEEYKIWKKNTAFLYDYCYTRALDWPTLTTQWFPDKRIVDEYTSEHRILLATSTTDHEAEDPQNYVMVCTVEMPDCERPDPPKPEDYNPESGEIGSHGGRANFDYRVTQKMNHPGDVNKARYCPQNPFLIATMSGDGNSYIFDTTKHTSMPRDRSDQYDIKLVGHEQEGYGLSWNPHVEGQLATGTEDNTVRLWDLNASFTKGSKTVSPITTHNHHTATVNDVAHHPINSMWVGTVSDDLTLQVIDIRVDNRTKVPFKARAHKDAVNCLAFHPKWEVIVATGSADKGVALWDLRMMDKSIHRLEGHKDAVIKLEFSPHESGILASASYDRRIICWDLSQIGEELPPDEAEEGPAELLFMHGGFTQRVSDFSWNKTQPWVIAGAAEDNQVQFFRPSHPLVAYNSSKSKRAQVNMDEIQERLEAHLATYLKRGLLVIPKESDFKVVE